jgi:hypothetical protein
LLNDCYLSNIALVLNPSRKEANMAEAKSTTTTAQKAAPATTAAPQKTAAAKPAAAPKAAAPKKVAAAKPAAAPKKAAVAKPAAAKKAPAKKAAATKKAAAPKKHKPGPEELYRMIETAAYFIAERNGFAGDSQSYWAEAEVQIKRTLK